MRSSGRPLVRLLAMVADQRGLFVLAVLLGTVHQGSAVAGAGLGGWLVGAAATGTEPSGLRAPVWTLAALCLVSGAARWGQYATAHDLAYRIAVRLRLDVYDGVARSAPGDLSERRTGNVAATVMEDVEATERFFAHTIADTAVAAAVSAGVLLAMLRWHPALAGALLPFLAVAAAAPFPLASRARQSGTRLRAALGNLNADVVDGVQGLRELLAARAFERHVGRLHGATRDLRGLQTAYGSRAGVEAAVVLLAGGAGTLIVTAVAVALRSGGQLDLADLPAVSALAAASFGPVALVSGAASQLGDVRAAARRIVDLADAVPLTRDEPTAGASHQVPVTSEVAFRDVRFRYPGTDHDVLRGADLRIEAGQTVALVGSSGAGKTTCVNLLLRFWDVDAGSVEIGGVDVRRMRKNTLREHVAVVSQDAHLFRGTVAENLLLARPGATRQEVEHVARVAQAHRFITALPAGYDTMIGERGATLSGGQRQRIAIARALLRRAPVLILDEAVSALDTESEADVRTAMAGAFSGRTTLVVAHRLSTVRTTDRVIVLDGGRVVESGTHQDLVDRNGAYTRLLAAQR